jgi:histidyl-tRNA synthetase
MGDVVAGIILQENGLLPEFVPTPASVLVTVFDESMWMKSFELAAQLRSAGFKTMVFPEPAKLQRQFKFADKMKIKIALTVGPDEAANDSVAVKNLVNGEQITVKREAVFDIVKKLMD